MKVRFDFVTNSSSSSFVVRVGVRLNNGKEVKYEAFAEDDGGGYDDGEVRVDRNFFNNVADIETVDQLVNILENAVSYYVLDWDTDQEVCKTFDSKDLELYANVEEKTYTRDDYLEAAYGFGYEGNDDPEDGRSVPFSKGIAIFDKEIKKKVKDLDDIKSVIVESVHTASGESIDGDDFAGLDWSESSSAAESVSIKEMDLKTGEISEKTSTEWL